jgi:hypothetical protein
MTQVDTDTGMYISNRAVKKLPIIDKILVLTLANLWNFSNTLIQVAVPGLSYVIAFREKALKCSVEDRYKCKPTVQKSHEEILIAE